MAPRSAFAVTVSFPPCASTIEQQIDRPMPRPSGFVAFRIFRIDPWTRILHCDRDGIGPGFRGLDQQFSRSVVDVVHCFNGVDAQVQKHLFQLDQISINERQVLRELRLDRDAVLLRFNAGDCFAYDAAARTI